MSISSPPAAAKLRLLSSSTIPHQPLIPLRSKRAHLSAPKASVSNGNLQFAVASTSLSTVDGSELTSTVGSPVQLNQWNLGPKHISLLNVTACAVAISASWLFFSAIPTLLAFRKAANSLEKLLEVTAEELPDTMAAVRLSGMEISDLTTELSDLGQEITQGVRSSTRAVRVAEDRIRGIATMTPKGTRRSNEKDGGTESSENSKSPS
ncbi:hypothetical protein LUZ60_000972 [Juncus effusus]|nr:hypothetical protein LUZ60_000972 [Juncus effusus]